MSHSITIKLNKAANEFQAGESVGFGIRGGVRYYDRKLKSKEWTNYTAAVFVRNPEQAAYYREVLVEGAIVELSGKQLKIDSYDGQNGQVLSIELLDAWIGSINQSAPRQDQAAPQPAQAQPQVTQISNSVDNFSDDIPF